MTDKVEQIFVSALEIDSKENLKGFLDRACQGDARVRAEVEDMLAMQPRLDKIFPEGGVVFDLNEDFFSTASQLGSGQKLPG
jgi:hypothetical protein